VDPIINFYKMCYASALVQNGAKLIATNCDANVQKEKFKMPVCGALVKAIEFASEQEAHVVGKPNADVIQIPKTTMNLNPNECIMVGDRLDSDILLGKNAQIDTFAVLTGVTSEERLRQETTKENGIIHTYYWDRVEI